MEEIRISLVFRTTFANLRPAWDPGVDNDTGGESSFSSEQKKKRGRRAPKTNLRLENKIVIRSRTPTEPPYRAEGNDNRHKLNDRGRSWHKDKADRPQKVHRGVEEKTADYGLGNRGRQQQHSIEYRRTQRTAVKINDNKIERPDYRRR